jgi:hypothetical protein
MKRRELFKGVAALLAGTALAPFVIAAKAQAEESRGFIALNNGHSFDTYWLGDDGFYMLKAGEPSLRALDSNFMFGSFMPDANDAREIRQAARR